MEEDSFHSNLVNFIIKIKEMDVNMYKMKLNYVILVSYPTRSCFVDSVVLKLGWSELEEWIDQPILPGNRSSCGHSAYRLSH